MNIANSHQLTFPRVWASAAPATPAPTMIASKSVPGSLSSPSPNVPCITAPCLLAAVLLLDFFLLPPCLKMNIASEAATTIAQQTPISPSGKACNGHFSITWCVGPLASIAAQITKPPKTTKPKKPHAKKPTQYDPLSQAPQPLRQKFPVDM